MVKQKICSFAEVIWQSFVAVQLARLRVLASFDLFDLLFTAFERPSQSPQALCCESECEHC